MGQTFFVGQARIGNGSSGRYIFENIWDGMGGGGGGTYNDINNS